MNLPIPKKPPFFGGFFILIHIETMAAPVTVNLLSEWIPSPASHAAGRAAARPPTYPIQAASGPATSRPGRPYARAFP